MSILCLLLQLAFWGLTKFWFVQMQILTSWQEMDSTISLPCHIILPGVVKSWLHFFHLCPPVGFSEISAWKVLKKTWKAFNIRLSPGDYLLISLCDCIWTSVFFFSSTQWFLNEWTLMFLDLVFKILFLRIRYKVFCKMNNYKHSQLELCLFSLGLKTIKTTVIKEEKTKILEHSYS